MGNSVGEGIWDNHPHILKNARTESGITGKGGKNVKETYRAYVSENVTVHSPKVQSSAKTADDAKRAAQIMEQNRKASTPATKSEAKANARGLKAANAPVSKNNAGQTGSKLKSDILKNAKPARPNRIRGGSLRGTTGAVGTGGGMNWETK